MARDNELMSLSASRNVTSRRINSVGKLRRHILRISTCSEILLFSQLFVMVPWKTRATFRRGFRLGRKRRKMRVFVDFAGYIFGKLWSCYSMVGWLVGFIYPDPSQKKLDPRLGDVVAAYLEAATPTLGRRQLL